MYTTIQKWGNSQAVRLPKAILEKAELHENDKVEIKVQDGKLLIVPVKKHKTLAERIAEYQEDYTYLTFVSYLAGVLVALITLGVFLWQYGKKATVGIAEHVVK